MVKRHNPHITELDLTSNRLAALPSDLAELRYLRVLHLKYNKFAAIPDVCLQLPRLATLDVAGNNITALPDEISQLQALTQLDISGNRLSQLTGGSLQAVMPHVQRPGACLCAVWLLACAGY